jgi:hypothetical protein
VAGHGPSHGAKADETDVGHVRFPNQVAPIK